MDNTGFTIPPKLYDFLKYIALVLLPAFAALALALGLTLKWDGSTVVAGVITVIDTFLGTILGKSASNYKNQEPDSVGDLMFRKNEYGQAEISKVMVNQENPVFKAGQKVYLKVTQEVEQ